MRSRLRSTRSPSRSGSIGSKSDVGTSSARTNFRISFRAERATTAATITPSSRKVLDHADYKAMVERRDALRASGMMAGIGIAACLEPSGGNSSFEPLLNEKNKTTTWMESCRIMVDALGFVTVTIHTTSAGQGHESLAATVVGEVLEIDPDLIRVVRPDSLASLPSNTPGGKPDGDHAGRSRLSCRAEAESEADPYRSAPAGLRTG